MTDRLLKRLEQTGQFPGVELRIQPLNGPGETQRPPRTITRFLSYEFDSSMLVPVDTFSFTFALPDDPRPFSAYFREGDLVQLACDGRVLSTGIIDSVEVDVDSRSGERITVQGRDLLSQFEDQDAISSNSDPVFARSVSVNGVFKLLSASTRIQRLRTQDAPTRTYLFATEPGETKLSALSRFMEPLNIIAWMDPDGTLVIGRPNMAQETRGTLILDKFRREANVLAMKAVHAAALVPNIYLPIWVGQEIVQTRVAKAQQLLNASTGPARLLRLGHQLPKTVIVSNPDGGSASDLAGVNQIAVASAQNATLLQSYAKREAARQNVKELSVQAVAAGHLDADGSPFQADTTYRIRFDRGGIDEKMYCYGVKFSLSVEEGQRTTLSFTKLGTIVSDVRAR